MSLRISYVIGNNAFYYIISYDNVCYIYLPVPATFYLPSTLRPVSSAGGLVFIFFQCPGKYESLFKFHTVFVMI